MSNVVNKWCSDIQGAEYGFFKAVVQALESFNNGDANSLGKLLCIVNGKTCKRIKRKELERLPYATPLKRILEHSFEGVEYKFDKEQDFGVVFKRGDNSGVSLERIEALKVLGSQTIRSKAFKDTFPAIKKETKQRDKKSVVQSQIRAAKKAEMSREEMHKLIDALWNETEVK